MSEEIKSQVSFQPELWVGAAGKALEFYTAAFAADVIFQVGSDDDIVAQLGVGDARFWVGSADPSMGRLDPKQAGGRTGRVLLIVADPDGVHRAAVRAGATETSPVSDEHGWRVGRIVDPFGHEWEIGRHVAD